MYTDDWCIFMHIDIIQLLKASFLENMSLSLSTTLGKTLHILEPQFLCCKMLHGFKKMVHDKAIHKE